MHTRCPMVKSDASACTNLVEDIMLAVPMSSIQRESDLLQAPKSTESSKENLETINILELMEGLTEEDISANFENLHVSSYSLLPEVRQESSTSVTCKPSDKVHASEAVSANKKARIQRPKYSLSISSIGSMENVDMALSARRGMTLSPLKSSRQVCQHQKNMKADPIEKENLDKSIHPHDENIGISILECTSITTIEDQLNPNRKNLQRVLSFNYMFTHSSSKRQNFLDTNGDAHGTPVHEATSTICDTLQILPSPWEAADNCNASSSESFCFRRELPRLQCQDGPEVEDCGIPVFDPEMIDSFENAIRHLSKEEWDAVRGMEESPHNFLRLVKALKKSRSNSARSKKENAANLKIDRREPVNNAEDAKDHYEPWESPDRKSKFVRKTRTFTRQNSLDVGSAFSQVRVRDDKGTVHVVFYSCTAQVGSKAYGDCSLVRSILQSLVGVSYKEKCVSKREEFAQELRHALNISVAIVPTISVKGNYLVGIENILHLYKKGLLGSMLREAGGLRLEGDGATDLQRVESCLLAT